MLQTSGLPYVIENVAGAPLDRASTLFGSHGVLLCGSMFGLGASGRQLRRHRVFETTFPVSQPPCRHRGQAVIVAGHAAAVRTVAATRARARSTREAMGIDWTTKAEIPGHPAGLHTVHR